MKLSRIFAVAVLSTAILGPNMSSIANAQVTKQGAGYLFRIKYVKGQVMKYNMAISGKNPGAAANAKPMVMNMPMSMKVVDVKNGVATIESSVTAPGSKTPQVQTMKMDNRGNVVGGAPGAGSMTAGTNLPQNPVPVGGSWTAKAAMAAGMNANATYKFKSIKNVGGKNVAVIDVSMNAAGQMRAAGNGTMYMSMADCSLVSMSMVMKMASPDGKTSNNMTLTMTRTN